MGKNDRKFIKKIEKTQMKSWKWAFFKLKVMKWLTKVKQIKLNKISCSLCSHFSVNEKMVEENTSLSLGCNNIFLQFFMLAYKINVILKSCHWIWYRTYCNKVLPLLASAQELFRYIECFRQKCQYSYYLQKLKNT
jgi:hypothetical protein